MGIDEVSPEVLSALSRLDGLSDHLELVANQFAVCAPDLASEQTASQLMTIKSWFDEFSEFDFVFSGRGFVPVLMPDGGVGTIYTDVSDVRGQFNALEVHDAADLEYYEEDVFEISEKETSDVYQYESDLVRRLGSRALTPSHNRMVYVEFLLEEDDVERNIDGIAFRTNSARKYAVMDASTLRIEGIEPRASNELSNVDIENLDEIIQLKADHFWQKFNNRAFKELPAHEQKLAIEQELDALNAELPVQNLEAMLCPRKIFVPTPGERQQFTAHKVHEDFQDLDMLFTTLQFDCMDLQQITEGAQIRYSGDSISGGYELCIVAQVDELMQKRLGSDKSIVWIPIQRSRKRQAPFSAVFIKGEFTL